MAHKHFILNNIINIIIIFADMHKIYLQVLKGCLRFQRLINRNKIQPNMCNAWTDVRASRNCKTVCTIEQNLRDYDHHQKTDQCIHKRNT